MDNRLFISNSKGEKTHVIVSIAEFEDLLHKRHLRLELTDGYTKMMDDLLDKEANGSLNYISYSEIKTRFQR